MTIKYSRRNTSGKRSRKTYNHRKNRNRKGSSAHNTQRFINRDKLNHASAKAVGSAMVELFATLQKKRPELQLLALASAFILVAETFQFPTNDTYAAVVNLWKDPMTSSGKGLQWDAMAYHLRTELDGQEA